MDYYDLYDITPEDEAKLDAQAAEQETDDWLASWSDDFNDDNAFTEIEVMLAAWRAGQEL